MRQTLQAALLALMLLPTDAPLMAKSWSEAISDVQDLAAEYELRAKEATELEDEYFSENGGSVIVYQFGNSSEQIDRDEHLCAILGRRLGKVEYIRHLEAPQPPFTSDARTLATAAASLQNWVRMAEYFTGMSPSERAHYWNLECVGNHEIPRDLFDGRGGGEVFMSVSRNYLWIYGDVTDGFADKVAEALDANPQVDTVGIGSGGGSVLEAILAGLDIRRRQIITQLTGPCYSACPLVFLGGVKRNVFRPYPPLGFHQAYGPSGTVPFDHELYKSVADYVAAMGANPDWVLLQMYASPPMEMNIQGDSAAERDVLCAQGLVSWFQGLGSTVC